MLLKMLLSSACLLALVACAPATSVSTENKVLKIHLETHHKYGELTLENLVKHVAEIKQLLIDNNGTVPMHNYDNIYYIGPMTIGTPGQMFNMTFVSESADLWVTSKKLCRKPEWKELCSHHNVYNSKESSTYKKKGKGFFILDGYVQGILSQDTITVGNLSVPKQVFGEVTNFSWHPEWPYDGVFGLAYPDASELNAVPPFVNMVKHKVVDQPVFAFYLSNCTITCGCQSSELVLGGTDPKHYKGDLVYVNVTEKKYFTVKIDGLALGPEVVVPSIDVALSAGSFWIYGPKNYTDYINIAIGGFWEPEIQFYIVACHTISSLPDITITVGGVPFVMKPYDYIRQLPGPLCLSGFNGLDLEFMILGDIFLRSVYTVYDMGNNRVGLAQAK